MSNHNQPSVSQIWLGKPNFYVLKVKVVLGEFKEAKMKIRRRNKTNRFLHS